MSATRMNVRHARVVVHRAWDSTRSSTTELLAVFTFDHQAESFCREQSKDLPDGAYLIRTNVVEGDQLIHRKPSAAAVGDGPLDP